LQLRISRILSTVAMVKELAEAELLPETNLAPDPHAPIPKQIRYIIGNEGCERFSFYGMRNILTVFLVSSLLLYLPEAERGRGAKDIFHTFVIGVYFFPLLGGWLAEPFFWQVQHRLVAESGLLRWPGVPRDVCHESNRFLYRARTDRARFGWDQTMCGRVCR
jgi:hypothetical protein